MSSSRKLSRLLLSPSTCWLVQMFPDGDVLKKTTSDHWTAKSMWTSCLCSSCSPALTASAGISSHQLHVSDIIESTDNFLGCTFTWRAAQVLTTQGLVTHSSHFSFLFFCKNITVWFTTGPSLGSYFETSVTASCFPTGSLGAVLVLLSIISSGNFSFHLRHVGLQLVLLWKRCSLRI